MPIIPELGRLRQEDHEFKASLDYIVRLKKKLLAYPSFLLLKIILVTF
jgi:hypothetical protein